MFSNYHKEICNQMKILSLNKKVIFIGQQVGKDISDFYGTLKNIPEKQRVEMPVAEEMQLGMSIGMALEGFLPISIFQRIDFIPRAFDQMVNHLDIIKELSKGRFNPKVIIRTTVGSKKPLDTGLQHSKNLSAGFSKLLKNIPVMEVKTAKEVKTAYTTAIKNKGSFLIVEFQDLYNTK